MVGPALVSTTCLIYREIRTYTRPVVAGGVGATCFRENSSDQLIKIVIAVGVVEAFGESVDEDTRIRVFQLDLGVGSVVVINGQEYVSDRVFSFGRSLARRLGIAELLCVLEEVVSNNRVNLSLSEEATPGLESAEQEQGRRHADRGVDTVLNAAKDRYEHTSEEDRHLQR